jgi:acyl transferase domain-containing protein/acyl-CoA synthetase (AMP-forming)/AMP-acid ligase II/thioesterase domain-containing protein
MNIASWADTLSEAADDFDAFVFDDRTYRNAWCHDAVCRLAQAFASKGIAPGDRVVLLLPNVIEHVLARFAVLRAGAVGVCVAPTAAPAEIERIVDHSGANAIVADAGLVADVGPAVARVGHRIVAGEAEGWIALHSLIAAHPPMTRAVPRAADDLAQITYTSGVSSAPKGVLLTHGSFEGRADLAQRQRAAAGAGLEGTVRLAVLPFSYSWGSSTLFATLREKTKLVCLTAFEPGAVLSAVERHRVERLSLVPPMCEALVAFPGARQFDLSSLKTVEISGAPVADDLLDRFESALHVRPVALYGLTEHAGVTMPSATRKPGSSGRVRPGVEARIVDADGRDLPIGEAGELLLASPVLAAGYYRDAEATARTFREGWMHTGDLARLDQDRDLYIIGRVKELIIQGGVNVYPSDVVDVITRLDGVRECAVVGIPNAFLGEEVTACVVLADGARLSEDEVLAFCRRNMDVRKAPTNVRFLPALLRTSSGKVKLADIRTQIIAERVAIVKTELVHELEGMAADRRRTRMRAVILACVRSILPGPAIDVSPEGTLDKGRGGAWPRRTFGEMGIDSIGAVVLANALSHRLGRPFPPTVTFNHVTVEALADHLIEETFGGAQPLPSAPLRRGYESGLPIAVVGIGCRLPGDANGPASFWELLKAGVDATTDVPRTRFDVDAVFDPAHGALGKTYVRRGAFVKADEFDAAFFDLGPREAEALAPEHRLLLEVTWEALEHAGYPPLSLAESLTSVFLGMTESHYGEGRPPNGDLSPAVAAGRVSHFFNFRGPSVAVDTACSASLVAVHQAVQSLRLGESAMAIAAGVKVTASATRFVRASQKQIVSADGRTRAFDAEASGTSLGEGCVAVVLKRLEDAEASGDRVLAIIRGSAINNDGRSASLAAPNGKAQEAVIRAALRDAGVSARDVDYLEAHGTATILGDPIELQAALAVYGEDRASERPLIVGSVKTNIGHLEAAAGLAGLVKAVLALQHREIPASLNFKRLNPAVAPLSAQVDVPTQARRWPESANGRRRAAVTSMGISGTNSHVVLEEAPEPRPAPDSPDAPALLTLSARSARALDQQVARYGHHLAAHPDIALTDLCATAALGRTHFDERIAVAATSREELQASLTALARGEVPAGCARGSAVTQEPLRLAFLFPGQGAQYAGMGRTLYEREPVFRAALDRCAAATERLLDRPLFSVLFSDDAATLLDETAYAQPALFALAVSLAELWRSWGIVPDAVVGQSQGEIAAACVAGALSLEDAAKVVCRRSRLLRPLRGRGAMAVVGLSEAQTLERLTGRTHQISVAVTNGSASTVVSGDIDAVQALVGELDSQGVFCRRLRVDYSSHSHHVDEIRGELRAALADIDPREGGVPLYSTVTCERLSGRGLDADYWVRNLRQPVRFASLMTKMVGEGFGRFVEVSPHPSMGMAMAEWIGSIAGGGWVPSLRRDGDDRASMLTSLGELYVRGVEVDWNRLYTDARWRRAELPTYAFERRRYWRMASLSAPVELATESDTDPAETLPAKQAFRERLVAAAPEERSALLIAQLRTLLSGLLGDAAATLPVESNLLSRGMNSLRIMSFLASVQRAVDCICLPVDFIRQPTLRGFAAYLEERLAPAGPAVEPASGPSVAAAPELVVLRAEGSEPAVFCSHPAGGQVTAYLRLRTLLGEERPLYAIQSRACQDPDREHESLAAMASDYANIIQATRPGPYVLVGWSMGAVLSHAIAGDLEQRGQDVRLVAMIDPPQAAGLDIDELAAAVWAVVLELRPEHAADETILPHVRGLAALPHRGTAELLARCEELGFLEKGSLSAQAFDVMVRLRLRHFQLVRAHRPGTIRSDMAIWWAGEPGLPSGWSAHTHGRLAERSLGGSHYSIVLPPRIDVVANELRALCGGESRAAAATLHSQNGAGLTA